MKLIIFFKDQITLMMLISYREAENSGRINVFNKIGMHVSNHPKSIDRELNCALQIPFYLVTGAPKLCRMYCVLKIHQA